MNKLTKKEHVIIAAVFFFLAAFSVVFSTVRISDLREQNKDNLNYGMNFIQKSMNNEINAFDVIEGKLTLQDMEKINAKVTFYTWFRIIGGIIFTAGGVYFAVSAKKKDEEQAEVAEDNSAENE